MTSHHFIIPGKPYAKKRHRTAKGGRTYNPPENVAFERSVGLWARGIKAPLVGPVRLAITAVFEPAKSHSKARRGAMMGKSHTFKPDGDNIAKAIKDGLNGVAWRDDCQVAQLTCVKRWGPEALTSVTITAIEEGDW